MDKLNEVIPGNMILYWANSNRWIPAVVLSNIPFGFSRTLKVVNTNGTVFERIVDHVSMDYIKIVPPV